MISIATFVLNVYPEIFGNFHTERSNRRLRRVFSIKTNKRTREREILFLFVEAVVSIRHFLTLNALDH